MLSDQTGPRITPLFVFASLLAFAAAAPYASAKSHKSNAQQASTEKIKIVAHLDLPGIHVKQMFVRNTDDHNYLYLERPHKHAFAVVDVTRPSHPSLIDRAVLPSAPGGSVNLPAQGSVLAISVRPDQPPAADSDASVPPLPTESIRLVDMSDPKHPVVLKTFENVTSIATDDGRKLVYIVNNEGLWIVSHHQERPLPLCSSDADIAALPSCE